VLVFGYSKGRQGIHIYLTLKAAACSEAYNVGLQEKKMTHW